ncbi:S8 family peptidase [Acidovorax sp. NCPPB 4044]|uniref:S8 family peptidase n=1 Tax=Acidovorax sp. NCPPB 4044 TaxID=2940490 RepID=UPI00230215D8|nr:S8 family serine peptidase [Acidovorax sp. NCPPB 4044]MDA8523716.1 S8 family serine peptidase [Acidovorax sp. NCPPB 4044]
MEKDSYLVLRVTGGGAVREAGHEVLRSTVRSHGFSVPTASAFGVEPPQYRVDTQVLDAKDYKDLRQDRTVAAIAKPMPLRRIAPVPSAAAAPKPAPADGATWGVRVTGALQSPYLGYGVCVAVLDTGIDAGHEAFTGIELVQKDFTGEGNGDADGHGTHVAGTIFGQPGSGLRYAVAPGVRRALIGKVIGQNRSATTKELIDAIQWAADERAHIVNMSLGFDFPGLTEYWVQQGLPVDLATSRSLAQYRDNVRFFDATMNLLRARSAEFGSPLVVAAAGNESRRLVKIDHVIEVSPPAAADGMVSVAALESLDADHTRLGVAPFSNIRVSLAAPGHEIYSARAGGGYTFLSGTSMASPHVAGVAALWAERQLKQTGRVSMSTLDAQLRGNVRSDRLAGSHYLDVGDGLVTAPSA